jgi:2-keto-3-deoxy-L-rhamnonate aldolase RhmA
MKINNIEVAYLAGFDYLVADLEHLLQVYHNNLYFVAKIYFVSFAYYQYMVMVRLEFEYL